MMILCVACMGMAAVVVFCYRMRIRDSAVIERGVLSLQDQLTIVFLHCLTIFLKIHLIGLCDGEVLSGVVIVYCTCLYGRAQCA